jgi:hypothetical protein
MSTKTQHALAVITAAAVLALGACGRGGESAPDDPIAATAPPVDLEAPEAATRSGPPQPTPTSLDTGVDELSDPVARKKDEDLASRSD